MSKPLACKFSFPFLWHRTQAEVPYYSTERADRMRELDSVILDMTAKGFDRETIADAVGCGVTNVSVRRRAMGITQ